MSENGLTMDGDALLTAYALGELPADEARAMERRLEQEPEAREQVAAVRALASDLEAAYADEEIPALRPDQRAAVLAPAPIRIPGVWRRSSARIMLAAAMIALAAVVAVPFVMRDGGTPVAIDMPAPPSTGALSRDRVAVAEAFEEPAAPPAVAGPPAPPAAPMKTAGALADGAVGGAAGRGRQEAGGIIELEALGDNGRLAAATNAAAARRVPASPAEAAGTSLVAQRSDEEAPVGGERDGNDGVAAGELGQWAVDADVALPSTMATIVCMFPADPPVPFADEGAGGGAGGLGGAALGRSAPSPAPPASTAPTAAPSTTETRNQRPTRLSAEVALAPGQPMRRLVHLQASADAAQSTRLVLEFPSGAVAEPRVLPGASPLSILREPMTWQAMAIDGQVSLCALVRPLSPLDPAPLLIARLIDGSGRTVAEAVAVDRTVAADEASPAFQFAAIQAVLLQVQDGEITTDQPVVDQLQRMVRNAEIAAPASQAAACTSLDVQVQQLVEQDAAARETRPAPGAGAGSETGGDPR